MFRAIGVILLIWFLSAVFTKSFSALDDAGSATFHAIEAAAVHTEENFE